MRRTIELSAALTWDFTREGVTEKVQVPHTWNALDGQDGGGDYWRGAATYETVLPELGLEPGEEAWLEFEGASQVADVFVNDVQVAHHEGGYSTFRANITGALAGVTGGGEKTAAGATAGGEKTAAATAADGENRLTVTVDNSASQTVYPQTADFTFYGGLYRPVRVVIVPAAHFALGRDGGPGLYATPTVDLAARTAEVVLEAWVEGAAPGETVTFEVADQQVTGLVDASGHACANVLLADVHLWDGLDDPYLYTLRATLASGDEKTVRFGCRTMEATGDGFFLNGRPYPLRGVSRHQDRAGVGCALTPEMHREDMAIIREMGANAIRLAHYQHAQDFYDLCDELGVVCWAEVPVITMRLPAGDENALSQMRELITQNRNHPSVYCWALSNEITTASAMDDALLSTLGKLNDLAHELDPSRPTANAHVFMLDTASKIAHLADVNAYNLYYGWYVGELEQNDEFFDAWHAAFPDEPMGLTEYGADCNPQFQAAEPARGDYSEQYQCLYHEHMLRMLEARPWMWCSFVWNMFDFGADGRNGGGNDGKNQKGLVTIDRKVRKDAFYLYRAFWSDEPFVHVCGRRYAHRAEDVTKVVVYSNQPQVELYVDGEKTAVSDAGRVFGFEVDLAAAGAGEHRICAVAGGLRDEIVVEHVDAPDESYALQADEEVANWFDDIVIDQRFFSVKDTIGELQAHPVAGAIVGRMMEAAAERYGGDVASQAMSNPAIRQIMERSSLESLLTQAGAADPETVKQLNDALQKIEKP